MEWRREPSLAERELMIRLAAHAVEQSPGNAEIWLTLADLHLLGTDYAQAETVLNRAIAAIPSDPRLRAALARVQHKRGHLDSAVREAALAVRLDPSNEASQLLHFELLLQTNEGKAPTAKIQALKDQKVSSEKLLAFLLKRSRSDDDLHDLLEYCEAILSDKPGCTAAIHTKAIALSKLGDAEAACAALSLHNLVQVSDLPAGRGYANSETFHRELIAEIEQHPSLLRDPLGHTTKGGHQTALLKSSDGRAICALIDNVQQEVERYVASLPEECPFALNRPQNATLSIWAVLYDDAGLQESHYHADGWLSGVYYAEAGSGTEMHPGHLLLGATGSLASSPPPWGVRAIEPIPGRLVLFPSYVPHATSAASQGRIAIAFDVVPSA